ncbi:MAG TPA: metal-dependent hydrolase [Rhodocyclaceae bacterium]|nr:metal-dependent hydrolase [Rhodocyclaceae bacterium]
MPSILSHPAVPLAIGLGLGGGVISKRLLTAGIAVSMLPDVDVIGFQLGIPYGSEFGHRGFSHSLVAAGCVALLLACAYRALRTTRLRAFVFLFVAMASQGMLDAFTNGGSGIAFLWPFSGTRYFAPVRMIEVSPIGVSRFLSTRGAMVLWSEFCWVWLPCIALGTSLALMRWHLSNQEAKREM